MNLPAISWPTAAVLLGVLALAGVLVWADHGTAATVAAMLGAVLTALCRELLPKAPPREGGGA